LPDARRDPDHSSTACPAARSRDPGSGDSGACRPDFDGWVPQPGSRACSGSSPGPCTGAGPCSRSCTHRRRGRQPDAVPLRGDACRQSDAGPGAEGHSVGQLSPTITNESCREPCRFIGSLAKARLLFCAPSQAERAWPFATRKESQHDGKQEQPAQSQHRSVPAKSCLIRRGAKSSTHRRQQQERLCYRAKRARASRSNSIPSPGR
jgi:hypothetical protein